ncbi:MAG: hypothetical protein U1E89_07465 [Burkholderiaceae bacterium]
MPASRRTPHRATTTALLIAAAGIAHAGRPLTVDDAGTNAKGEGHVELWGSRADGATTWNVSPAYALTEGLELAALASRDATHRITGTALQVKWLATPSRESGCNAGLAGGGSRSSDGGGGINAAFVNGIVSCNGTLLGAVHLNLGAERTSGASSTGTWGIALEREVGRVTPHVEWFGAEGSKPALQFGLRGDVAQNLQLDGTFGRRDGSSLYSVGIKLRF